MTEIVERNRTCRQPPPPIGERPLLEIKDLQVGFTTQDGLVKAVDGVNITLYRGQSLAIVGESGSGKSTTAHAIINLLPGTGKVTGGQILLDGQDLTKASPKEMEAIRGRKIGFVPQDPMSNLNPVWSIGFQVEEAIKANGIATGAQGGQAARDRGAEAGRPPGRRPAPEAVPAPVLGRHAPARADRHGPRGRPAAAHRRRADLGARRHGAARRSSTTSSRSPASSARRCCSSRTTSASPPSAPSSSWSCTRARSSSRARPREILQNPQHPYTQRLVAAAPSLASRRIQATGSISAAESVDRRRRIGCRGRHDRPDRDRRGARRGTRGRGSRAAGDRRRGPDQGVQDPRLGRVHGGRRGVVPDPEGHHHGARRRVGLGQVDRREDAAEARDGDERQDRGRRQGPRERDRQGALQPPQPDAAGVPGPVRLAEPAAQHRQHDRRAAVARTRSARRPRAARGCSSCSTRCRCRARSSAATRTSSRAASGSASPSRVRSR